MLLYIVVPLALYLLFATFGVIPFATYMKGRQVRQLTKTYSGYELRFSDKQKAIREFWDVVMYFSVLWPLEIVGGLGYLIYKGIVSGFKAIVKSASTKQLAIASRKELKVLQNEYDALSKSVEENDGKADYHDNARLESLKKLIGERKTQPALAGR